MNLHFGQDVRFKGDDNAVPGPGQYALNKAWNKKSYNLKFLNIKNKEAEAAHNRNLSL